MLNLQKFADSDLYAFIRFLEIIIDEKELLVFGVLTTQLHLESNAVK
jgi:hypothetical protein